MLHDYENLDEYVWLGSEVDRHETEQAKALGQLMIETLNPQSVIDLGCSSGIYLVPFKERGLEIHGVDGANGVGWWIHEDFEVFDLRNPYYPTHKFDLCYCIETAEHIRPEFAELLVETICRCSDTVFFSAAREGQNGESHLNCQNQPYWLERFYKFGFTHHPKHNDVMNAINSGQEYEHCMWLRWNGMLLGKQ